MIKINDCSENCSKSELDLFSLPPTQTDIDQYKLKRIEPVTGWRDNQAIYFKIEGTSKYFIDISATEIYCKLKESTMKTARDKDMFPANNVIHSLFKNIEVKKNGDKPIEKQDNLYPYRAYIEDLLNYDNENKYNYLGIQGFVKDDAGLFNNYKNKTKPTVDITGAFDIKTASGTTTLEYKKTEIPLSEPLYNSGANIRRDMVKNGNMFRGKLHLDTFNLNKYLLNGVSLQIELTKQDGKFFFMGDIDETDSNEKVPGFEIEEIFLLVKYVYVNESIMSYITNTIQKTNAMYPVKTVTLLTNQLVPLHAKHQISLATNTIPNRVILGFVDAVAQMGDYKFNPFNFENINIESIKLEAGVNSVPFDGGLNFKSSMLPAYCTLFNQLKESSCGINYDEYLGGSYLITFDLTPDQCNFEHMNLVKDGKINLEIELKSAIKKAYTMIVYMEHDKIMQIDKEYNINIL